jgi:hypothetical protein
VITDVGDGVTIFCGAQAVNMIIKIKMKREYVFIMLPHTLVKQTLDSPNHWRAIDCIVPYDHFYRQG